MKNISRYLILAVFLAMIPFVYFSCKSSRTSASSLRIISINNDDPLIVDARDWYPVSVDDEDTTYDYLVKDWIVPVELSYVETGLGLPTYPTPYTARCTAYAVIFNRIGVSPAWRPKITGALNTTIESDPNGTKQTNIKAIPSEWLAANMDSFVQPPEDPDRPGMASGYMTKATVVILGYEELTHNPVADTGYFTIDFGDYWDNPIISGSK